ncbi:MAG: P-II family nitrogen regulator [Alphaproteobacteria bacterium]|nr:P-II family nitrogen regulator [Alphaproteobacteria bacterium]
MSKEIVVLTDAVLITCIVQRGAGESVVDAAMQAGAQGATSFFARGTGVRQRHLGVLGITVNDEKEVVYIVVPSDQADYMFEKLYFAAKLDTPGMGIMYMTYLEKLATYVPQEVAARLVQS